MARLSDHWNDGNGAGGGDYLPEGDHYVGVSSCRMFDCRSGSPGVEFTLVDSQQRAIKHGFVMKPGSDANLRVLASFVRACGITEEQAATYDTDKEESHRMLLGKSCFVRVERTKPGKNNQMYCEVTQWWHETDTVPARRNGNGKTPQPVTGRPSYDGEPGESPLDEEW